MRLPATSLRGTTLTPADLDKLHKCGVPSELADSAMIRRVTSEDGGAIVGRNGSGDYSGIVFPYCWPGEDHVRDYRLRRDHPELEAKSDGGFKEREKYLSAPGRGNMLYFCPETDPAWLADPKVPIVITEGEKKTLALWGLAWHGLGESAERPRYLPVGLAGVWNFRGTIGKAPGPNGDRRDVKGVIPDIERIAWKDRRVTILFDRDVATNDRVQAARNQLTSELNKRGSRVFWFHWPGGVPEPVGGFDDLIGAWGKDKSLEALQGQSKPVKQYSNSTPTSVTLRSMNDVMDDASVKIPEQLVAGLIPKGGIVLLGGRPKDGKSWLACQLGIAIVTGEPLGGWFTIQHPGRVQLWALEDQAALTKDKITKLLGGSHPALRNMMLCEELFKPVLAGGDVIIDQALKQYPADLIILDSLFKLTGQSTKSYDISQKDYDVIDRVRQIALENNCAAVIVMHTKKGSQGGNPIENIIGTSGISAAADAVIELKRSNGKEGKLTVVGRSVPQEDYALSWQSGANGWGWVVEASGEGPEVADVSIQVLAYLEAQGASKPASIAAVIRKTFDITYKSLQSLQDSGKVVCLRDKRWDLRKVN